MCDENHKAALFKELGASPASMESSRIIDACSMIGDHVLQQADAQQAYTQATLEATPTWVSLPEDARPAEWNRFRNPVCPLRLALQGIPMRGRTGEITATSPCFRAASLPLRIGPVCIGIPLRVSC